MNCILKSTILASVLMLSGCGTFGGVQHRKVSLANLPQVPDTAWRGVDTSSVSGTNPGASAVVPASAQAAPLQPSEIIAAQQLRPEAGLGPRDGIVEPPVVDSMSTAFLVEPRLQYVIEKGDNLEIKVRNDSDLDDQVVVRPDGMISLPIVGDVMAAGATPEQLRAVLKDSLSREMRDPEVTVIVRSFSGNTIYVGGEVYAPGRVPLSGRITTLNAIILAGGFKDTADQQRVIVRHADGRCHEFDMKCVLECRGGQDIALQPYDMVYVPKSKIAKVNLWVEQYIEKVLPFSRSFGIFVSHNTGLTSAVGGP